MLWCLLRMVASKYFLPSVLAVALQQALVTHGMFEEEYFKYLTPLWKNGIPITASRRMGEQVPSVVIEDRELYMRNAVSLWTDMKSAPLCLIASGAQKQQSSSEAEEGWAKGLREVVPIALKEAVEAEQYLRSLQYAATCAVDSSPNCSEQNFDELFKDAVISDGEDSSKANSAWLEKTYQYFAKFRKLEAEVRRQQLMLADYEKHLKENRFELNKAREALSFVSEHLAPLDQILKDSRARLERAMADFKEKIKVVAPEFVEGVVPSNVDSVAKDVLAKFSKGPAGEASEAENPKLVADIKQAAERAVGEATDFEFLRTKKISLEESKARWGEKHELILSENLELKSRQSDEVKKLQQLQRNFEQETSQRFSWNSGGPLLPLPKEGAEERKQQWKKSLQEMKDKFRQYSAGKDQEGPQGEDAGDNLLWRAVTSRLLDLRRQMVGLIEDSLSASSVLDTKLRGGASHDRSPSPGP